MGKLKSRKFKVALSILITLLMLSGLSYEFYQNEYLRIKNQNKNTLQPETLVQDTGSNPEIKAEESAPTVETNSNHTSGNKNTTKTAGSSAPDRTEYRKLSPEVQAAAERVKNLGYYPAMTQSQIEINQFQKKIDEDNSKIVISKEKIAQYEKRIAEIEELMGIEGISEEQYSAYFMQRDSLYPLISNEWSQIYSLNAEIAMYQKFIDQEKQN